MSYTGTIRRLLISSPDDVPAEDLSRIHRTLNRWNVLYGPSFGSVVIPVSWGEHAAAEFGRPPQSIINDQLVDGSDICLAIFANRLGTKTAVAESGTAEEIERLSASGKWVGVLRCRRQADYSQVDPEQLGRLNEYLALIARQSLVLEYDNDADLERHVESVLVSAVSRDQGRADIELQRGPDAAATADQGTEPRLYAEVWPRLDVKEEARTDSKGRLKTRRNRALVLSNVGNEPARDVTFNTEVSKSSSGGNWIIHRSDNEDSSIDVENLAPHGGEVRFPVLGTMESAGQVQCTVSWTDSRGEQSNVATLGLS